MSSSARMIGTTGSSATEIAFLEFGWISSMIEMGFPRRIADVGHHMLTNVAILSYAEAKQVNESYRRHIEADRKAPESDIQYIQDIRKARFARELECAMRVDELLAALGDVDYFSTWIIVETADID
jgi:hypothetical protein